MELSLCWTKSPALCGIMCSGVICPPPPPPKPLGPLSCSSHLRLSPLAACRGMDLDGPNQEDLSVANPSSADARQCNSDLFHTSTIFLWNTPPISSLFRIDYYFFYRLINHSTDKEFRVHSSDHLGCSCKQPSFTVNFLALSQRV